MILSKATRRERTQNQSLGRGPSCPPPQTGVFEPEGKAAECSQPCADCREARGPRACIWEPHLRWTPQLGCALPTGEGSWGSPARRPNVDTTQASFCSAPRDATDPSALGHTCLFTTSRRSATGPTRPWVQAPAHIPALTAGFSPTAAPTPVGGGSSIPRQPQATLAAPVLPPRAQHQAGGPHQSLTKD